MLVTISRFGKDSLNPPLDFTINVMHLSAWEISLHYGICSETQAVSVAGVRWWGSVHLLRRPTTFCRLFRANWHNLKCLVKIKFAKSFGHFWTVNCCPNSTDTVTHVVRTSCTDAFLHYVHTLPHEETSLQLIQVFMEFYCDMLMEYIGSHCKCQQLNCAAVIFKPFMVSTIFSSRSGNQNEVERNTPVNSLRVFMKTAKLVLGVSDGNRLEKVDHRRLREKCFHNFWFSRYKSTIFLLPVDVYDCPGFIAGNVIKDDLKIRDSCKMTYLYSNKVTEEEKLPKFKLMGTSLEMIRLPTDDDHNCVLVVKQPCVRPLSMLYSDLSLLCCHRDRQRTNHIPDENRGGKCIIIWRPLMKACQRISGWKKTCPKGMHIPHHCAIRFWFLMKPRCASHRWWLGFASPAWRLSNHVLVVVLLQLTYRSIQWGWSREADFKLPQQSLRVVLSSFPVGGLPDNAPYFEAIRIEETRWSEIWRRVV